MLRICKALIHMFLMYCLVSQAVLELHIFQLIVMFFFILVDLSILILYYLLHQIGQPSYPEPLFLNVWGGHFEFELYKYVGDTFDGVVPYTTHSVVFQAYPKGS